MTLYEYGLRSKIRQAQRFILLAKDEVEKRKRCRYYKVYYTRNNY